MEIAALIILFIYLIYIIINLHKNSSVNSLLINYCKEKNINLEHTNYILFLKSTNEMYSELDQLLKENSFMNSVVFIQAPDWYVQIKRKSWGRSIVLNDYPNEILNEEIHIIKLSNMKSLNLVQ